MAGGRSDPLPGRPVPIELPHGGGEVREKGGLRHPAGRAPPRLAAKLLEILARGDDHARIPDLAVPRHDYSRLEPFELLEHGDPAVAVAVDLVGRGPREDRAPAGV